MSRRIFCMLLLLTLMVGAVGYKPSPVAASPSAKDSNSAYADYLPNDTVLYANLKTSDLPSTVNMFLNLAGKLSGTKPPSPYTQIDEGLTKFLGRDASFEKDVLPWLGANVTVGLMLSDADMIGLMSSPNANATIM